MNEFLSKLHNFKRGLNLRILARALVISLLCLVVGLHAYFLVWLNTPAQSPTLVYLNYALRALMVGLVLFLIYKGIRGFYDNRSAARWLDRQTEHEDDLYQNLWELKQQKESEPVLDALARQAQSRLKASSYRLPRLFQPSQWWLILFVLAGIGSVWALGWNEFRYALNQFRAVKADAIEYKKTVELSPGNVTIGKGQQLLFRVLEPDTRLKHRLFYRWDKQWRELGMTDNSYSFPALEYSIEYYVKNEVASSPVYNVVCLDEPFARSWSLYYKYPAYTGLGSRSDSLSYGNIEAYKHSEVIISLGTNIPVEKAVMRFSDGTSQALQRVEETSFSGRITVTAPKTWYLELTDALGRKSRPEEKTISVIPDNAPEIRIIYPGEDVLLDQSLLLPLIITASDDFGLRELSLHYQINDRPAQQTTLRSLIGSKLFTLDHTLDLKGFGLLPGDTVTYWAQVWDNSPDRQSAQSVKFKARFPSIEEIYREIERQAQSSTQDLQSTLKEAKDLQKDFEQKRRELMKDDKLDWEDKKTAGTYAGYAAAAHRAGGERGAGLSALDRPDAAQRRGFLRNPAENAENPGTDGRDQHRRTARGDEQIRAGADERETGGPAQGDGKHEILDGGFQQENRPNPRPAGKHQERTGAGQGFADIQRDGTDAKRPEGQDRRS